MDLTRDAIEKLVGLSEPHYLDHNGLKWSDKTMQVLDFDPRPATLEVATLTALAHYITNGPDKLTLGDWLLHVEGPCSVALVSKEGGLSHKRTTMIRAKMDLPGFAFGRDMDPETFIINLQTMFEGAGDLAKILQLVGTMTTEAVQTSKDDGITQTVTARKGVALAENVRVPNPVTLAPFRTFRELEQPESLFVFRVKDGPKCALYEADGAAWKLETIQRIRDWFTTRISGLAVIA